MSKTKFPRAAALEVVREMLLHLTPSTTRIIVAGSLRRRRQEVGDVEILYIPLTFQMAHPENWFEQIEVSRADVELEHMLKTSTITKRPNVLGRESWGPKNKLAIHTASGIPVDLFAATEANWWNYLVCRTGSAENNVRIASAAKAKGWEWHTYDRGFTDADGDWHVAQSEQEVFELAGLEYLEPWER